MLHYTNKGVQTHYILTHCQKYIQRSLQYLKNKIQQVYTNFLYYIKPQSRIINLSQIRSNRNCFSLFQASSKLSGFSYDKLVVLLIADCRGKLILKRTTCSFSRNFSGHSTAQIDVFRALLESPEKWDWCSLWNESLGKLEI